MTDNMIHVFLGFTPNLDGGRQGLIEHAMFLKGLPQDCVHCYMVIGRYVVEQCYDGLAVTLIEDMERFTQTNNFISGHVPRIDLLETVMLMKTEPISLLNAFRWFFGLPYYGYLCLDVAAELLEYPFAVEHPSELFKAFEAFIYNNGGVVDYVSTTFPYQLESDGY